VKLSHAYKIPISTVVGGLVLFLIAYLTEWKEGGITVRPSVRGLVAIACYGAVVSTLAGAAVAFILSRGIADQATPIWAQVGSFIVAGAFTPLMCVPFTAPSELFDFLIH
jgi:hypothetical protein